MLGWPKNGSSTVVTCCAGLFYFGCYLLFAGQLNWSEIATALPATIVATGFLIALHHCEARHMVLRRAPWPRLIVHSLAALPPDTVRVGRALLGSLLRPTRGEAGLRQSQPFRHGAEAPAEAGRRALVTLAVSLAPNGYVLDDADGTGTLLLHRMLPGPVKPDRDWPV